LSPSINRASLAWAGCFFGILLLSVLLFVFLADNKHQVVLFCPNDANHRLTGETRIVPRSATMEDNIETVVNSMILGPQALRHDRDVPRSTEIRSLLLRGSDVYLDFSPDILFPEQETSLGFSESLDAIRKTIKFNFPEVDRIIVTVNGEEPKSEIPANTR
jgi:spore germination protein GerM